MEGEDLMMKKHCNGLYHLFLNKGAMMTLVGRTWDTRRGHTLRVQCESLIFTRTMTLKGGGLGLTTWWKIKFLFEIIFPQIGFMASTSSFGFPHVAAVFNFKDVELWPLPVESPLNHNL